MTATPDRAAFVSREFRIHTVAQDEVRTVHPDARDGGESPRPSFFMDFAAAAAVNAERAALLTALPQRVAVTVSAAVMDLDATAETPTVRLVDGPSGSDTAAGLDLDADFLVSRLVLDLASETTSLELFRGQSNP